jgi:hypothetical protein
MRSTSHPRLLLAVAALVPLAAGALFAADAVRSTLKLKLHADGAADAVEIVDLDGLEVGERRDYTTEAGRPLTVTRDDAGYAIEVDGKTIRVAGDPHGLTAHPGMKMHRIVLDGDGEGESFVVSDDVRGAEPGMKMRRIEIDGDGEAKSFVIADGPEADRIVVRRGPGGAHAFAFGDGEPFVRFGPHGLLERLEKSDKFLALDDATQELVRELVRETAGPMHWVEGGDEEGHRVEVWLERHVESDDESPERK